MSIVREIAAADVVGAIAIGVGVVLEERYQWLRAVAERYRCCDECTRVCVGRASMEDLRRGNIWQVSTKSVSVDRAGASSVFGRGGAASFPNKLTL